MRACAAVAVGLLAISGAWGQEDGFVPLSGDPDLGEWLQLGGSNWSFDDGAIHYGGEGGGWLASRSVYEDFTLRFDYKIGQGGNSGVWLRCPLRGRQSQVGLEFQIMGAIANPPNANSTGSIYDVLPARVDPANPPGEWNSVEVQCLGSRVRAEMNGEPLWDVDLEDEALNARFPAGRKPRERSRRGYIGLTNHGSEVWYRNLRIRPEPEAGFVPLFDGESLEGWTQPADGWKVQDGCLVAEDEKAWLLTSAGEYGDYVLRLRYRVAEGASGAVHLRDVGGERNRVQIAVADDWGDPPSMTGSGALRGFGAPRVNASLPAGEWNDLEITYRGGEIAVRLNALPVTDGSIFWYSGWYRAPVRGRISLQPYGGRVEFRDVRIRELPTEATEPL